MIKAGSLTIRTKTYTGGAGSVIEAGSMSIEATEKISLEKGAVLRFGNGKQVTISTTCSMKKINSEGPTTMVITELNDAVHKYDVSTSFNYPDEAEAHLLGGHAAAGAAGE